jgi:phosphoglycolate phosphatase-like HAD superfamily hydrolase
MPTIPTSQDARIHTEPGFVWDEQNAYLFDIDGTLLRSRDRTHFNSFAFAVRQVTGFEITLEGLRLSGNTDTAILCEACEIAGVPADVFEQKRAAVLAAMCTFVDEHRNELEPYLMPGVEDALRHLTSKGAVLGLATGNLEGIGWTKIEKAGLREWFRFGGFSDRHPKRSELVANAAAKARELAGEHASVCVVGDTPRDIEAARANSLPVIAVATGNFSFDELAKLQPQVCASTLAGLLAHQRIRP